MVNAMRYENNLISILSLFERMDFYMVHSETTVNRKYNDLEICNRFIGIENFIDHVYQIVSNFIDIEESILCRKSIDTYNKRFTRNQRLMSPLLEFLVDKRRLLRGVAFDPELLLKKYYLMASV